MEPGESYKSSTLANDTHVHHEFQYISSLRSQSWTEEFQHCPKSPRHQTADRSRVGTVYEDIPLETTPPIELSTPMKFMDISQDDCHVTYFTFHNIKALLFTKLLLVSYKNRWREQGRDYDCRITM